jgi:N-acetylglucosamine kinase-like BadF-type ATPase
MNNKTTVFGVDAGGSKTRLLVKESSLNNKDSVFPSANPASVNNPSASWDSLFTAVANIGNSNIFAWIGSASVYQGSLDSEVDIIKRSAMKAGLKGSIILTNDVIPLLLASPVDGIGVIAAVGTGTSFMGRDKDGTFAVSSGYEYLIADEGGGFDLGLMGLKAAARAYDGRGRETTLLTAAINRYGRDIPDLGRWLAIMDSPKQEIGRFAFDVLQESKIGDVIANDIIRNGANAVIDGISSILSRLPSLTASNIVLSGGIVAGSGNFSKVIEDDVRLRWPNAKCLVIRDASFAALELSEKYASSNSSVLGVLRSGIPFAEISLG